MQSKMCSADHRHYFRVIAMVLALSATSVAQLRRMHVDAGHVTGHIPIVSGCKRSADTSDGGSAVPGRGI
jgi:hypothetical protein